MTSDGSPLWDRFAEEFGEVDPGGALMGAELLGEPAFSDEEMGDLLAYRREHGTPEDEEERAYREALERWRARWQPDEDDEDEAEGEREPTLQELKAGARRLQASVRELVAIPIPPRRQNRRSR